MNDISAYATSKTEKSQVLSSLVNSSSFFFFFECNNLYSRNTKVTATESRKVVKLRILPGADDCGDGTLPTVSFRNDPNLEVLAKT